MPSAGSLAFGLVVGWCCGLVGRRSWRAGAAGRLRAGAFAVAFSLAATALSGQFVGARHSLVVAAGIALGAGIPYAAARFLSRQGR